MFSRTLRFGGLLAICALALPVWADDETIESAEQKLVAVAGQIKAISFKVTTSSPLPGPAGAGNDESTWTVAILRHGDEVRFRQDVNGGGGGAPAPDKAAPVGRHMLIISDGQYAHILQEEGPQKRAMKRKSADVQPPLDMKAMLDTMRRFGALKLLPDEKVGEYDVFVVEVTANDASRNAWTKQMLYCAKDLGLPIKAVAYDKDGKTVGSLVVSEIKLDPEFPPDHFVFTAPEGVTVMDMSERAPPPRKPTDGPASGPTTKPGPSTRPNAEAPPAPTTKPDATTKPAAPEKAEPGKAEPGKAEPDKAGKPAEPEKH